MDFEVKHLICAGLDVHKKTIVAAVCMTDPVTLEAAYKMKCFSTNNSQIAAMRDWLLSYNCHDVCMESTGKYWIPVYNILEKDCKIVLAHPKYVKAIRGKKTDKKDAKWIADLFQIKRKESFAELSHGFQYPVGKRCLGHLRQICTGDTG